MLTELFLTDESTNEKGTEESVIVSCILQLTIGGSSELGPIIALSFDGRCI